MHEGPIVSSFVFMFNSEIAYDPTASLFSRMCVRVVNMIGMVKLTAYKVHAPHATCNPFVWLMGELDYWFHHSMCSPLGMLQVLVINYENNESDSSVLGGVLWQDSLSVFLLLSRVNNGSMRCQCIHE